MAAAAHLSLAPGPQSAPELDDGGVIGVDETNAPVDIDVLFNALNEAHAEGLNVIRGSGDWYDGKGDEANQSAKYFNPFLVSTTDLTREIALNQDIFNRLIKDTATTVSAIAERRDDLAGLVQHQHRVPGHR